ncbi:MAG: DNA-binding response regulator [Firmicutes bacterium HGW-Firmicutes-1]|jgi:DNA-binding LytR/AlgR family response regulator|nr:MAG: DNA-binding response regulator [Firmicutes bacterium HGW-Firmicutes-1]
MKFYFALCDDEKEHLLILHEKIANIMEENDYEVIVNGYESGQELINCIKNRINKYHIIFLDIQMTETNGIETGKRIRELNKNIIIIYITGFMDYSINAFEIRAFDYILKPINTNKLKKAILDAIVRIELFENQQRNIEQFLTLSYNKEILNIRLEDIIYIEKIKNKSIIICGEEKYEVYDSLCNIKKKLNENIFIQPHQGYIINKNKINHYKNQQLTLTSKYIVPVSKNNINTIRKAFFESLR